MKNMKSSLLIAIIATLTTTQAFAWSKLVCVDPFTRVQLFEVKKVTFFPSPVPNVPFLYYQNEFETDSFFSVIIQEDSGAENNFKISLAKTSEGVREASAPLNGTAMVTYFQDGQSKGVSCSLK